jgi:hypothetical protein
MISLCFLKAAETSLPWGSNKLASPRQTRAPQKSVSGIANLLIGLKKCEQSERTKSDFCGALISLARVRQKKDLSRRLKICWKI